MYPPINDIRAKLDREAIINAFADLALAARAGTILEAYQREWSWVDKQNYRDAVDADEFNAAFHGIEREFDRLAQILAQGSGLSMAPDWEQVITLTRGTDYITVSHDMGTVNLLVDLQARFIVPAGTPGAVGSVGGAGAVVNMFMAAPTSGAGVLQPGAAFWTNIGLGRNYAYGLLDENTILLAQNEPFSAGNDLMLRVRLWKLGE